MIPQGMEDYSNSYIDDVIVFSKCWEDHLEDVKMVLDSLKKCGLTAKPSKCERGATTLTYLGHTVGVYTRGKGGSFETFQEA